MVLDGDVFEEYVLHSLVSKNEAEYMTKLSVKVRKRSDQEMIKENKQHGKMRVYPLFVFNQLDAQQIDSYRGQHKSPFLSKVYCEFLFQ